MWLRVAQSIASRIYSLLLSVTLKVFEPGVPYLKSFATFVAENHQKWILTIGAVTIVTAVLASSSFTFYWFLYWLLVPNVALQQSIYFQYAEPLPNGTVVRPYAELNLLPRQVTAGQDYDAYVTLELPESEENRDAGMFMIGLEFYQKEEIVFSSTRPARLRYKSNLLETFSTVFFSLPLVLGLSEQKQFVSIRMVEKLNKQFQTIIVTLSKPNVQLYSATFSMQAQLTGIRYWFYHWFFTSFAVGTLSILVGQLMFVGIFWLSSRGLVDASLEDSFKVPVDVSDRIRRKGSSVEEDDIVLAGSTKEAPRSPGTSGIGGKEEELPKGREISAEGSPLGNARQRKGGL